MTGTGAGVGPAKIALVIGAGASWAAPAARPLFANVRQALTDRHKLPVSDAQWSYLAPEALLSRLQKRHIDVDNELRQMLDGGAPNALHYACAQALGAGAAVWTPNFDELIECAAGALGIELHVVTPDADPDCECARPHLFKVHGTLSGERVVARSEDVLKPLPKPWVDRLRETFEGRDVAIVG